AMGALGRVLGGGAVVVKGGALVEHQGDIGVKRGLHRHRALRREKALRAVDVGAKAHALAVDREDRPPAGILACTGTRWAGWAGLDLVGDRAVAHREHLKAAR